MGGKKGGKSGAATAAKIDVPAAEKRLTEIIPDRRKREEARNLVLKISAVKRGQAGRGAITPKRTDAARENMAKARAAAIAKMTAGQKTARAKKAVAARWAKRDAAAKS
jgi:hypothetical protein